MWRFSRIGSVLLAASTLVLIAGCGGKDQQVPQQSFTGQPVTVDGVKVPAKATSKYVQLATEDGFVNRFWPGVNLGSTTPGKYPGEVSARTEEYRRWFPQMKELGTRVIRVYTLLDPSFYTELRRYNLENKDDPLYVIHGIWIPEERFLATGNLYDSEVLAEERELIKEVHSAVMGDLERPERRGYAYGKWTADISPWVIGWSPGVEWDPLMTEKSEKLNPPRSYKGKYFSTDGKATSTEAWIAEQLDYLAKLDMKAGWSRAMTFTNWLTADPLKHPDEPLPREDLISVDAKKVKAEKSWPGGFFASYHAYPYYPDFLRLQPKYRDAESSYAAYLEEIKNHHKGQALMITEFGVPSALGKAHLGPQERDQGDHSEREAAEINADLLTEIKDAGLAGGLIFEWVDEWFKFTWNTIDEELPAERRALWRNQLTNEEHFGVIATEPKRAALTELDGSGDEWTENESQVVWEDSGAVREIRFTHDPQYLSLKIVCDSDEDCESLRLGLDLRPGENKQLPDLPGAFPEADVAIEIDGEQAMIKQAAWTDVLAFQYGTARKYLKDVDPQDLRKGSGVWRKPQLILNKPYTVPTTGEKRPVELQQLGSLPWGKEADDSRNLIYRDGSTIELRLPWALLGFSDPSSKSVTVAKRDGTITSEELPEDYRVTTKIFNKEGKLLADANGYGWASWQTVEWQERKKQGWNTLKDAFLASTEDKSSKGE